MVIYYIYTYFFIFTASYFGMFFGCYGWFQEPLQASAQSWWDTKLLTSCFGTQSFWRSTNWRFFVAFGNQRCESFVWNNEEKQQKWSGRSPENSTASTPYIILHSRYLALCFKNVSSCVAQIANLNHFAVRSGYVYHFFREFGTLSFVKTFCILLCCQVKWWHRTCLTILFSLRGHWSFPLRQVRVTREIYGSFWESLLPPKAYWQRETNRGGFSSKILLFISFDCQKGN